MTDQYEALEALALADPMLEGLYSPSKRMVGCVIIAAAYGIRDRRVNNLFDSRDWFVAPVEDTVRITAPLSQWRYIADLPSDERPGPEHFPARQALTQGPAHPEQQGGQSHG